METFTREQITKVIKDLERVSFDNPKACFVSATSETLEAVRNYFMPHRKVNDCIMYGKCRYADLPDCNDNCRHKPENTR